MTVLICTKNEEKNLIYLLPKIPDWVNEVLIVDGHSEDKTVEVAKQLCPRVRILQQLHDGKGEALRYGIEQSSGDAIVTLDADGSTNPEDIQKFIDLLLLGYDYVKGSRFLRMMPNKKPLHRIIGNWIIVMTFNILFFRRYTDLCSGYNAFWKRAIGKVNLLSSNGFADEPLINCRVRKAGLSVVEVGCMDKGRINGYSNSPSWRQGLISIKTILYERFHGI